MAGGGKDDDTLECTGHLIERSVTFVHRYTLLLEVVQFSFVLFGYIDMVWAGEPCSAKMFTTKPISSC